MFFFIYCFFSRNCVKEEFIKYVVISICLLVLDFFIEWNICIVSIYEYVCIMYRKFLCIYVYCML